MRVNATVGETLFIYEKETENVDSFTYLGSIVSKGGGADEDVRSGIRKANGAFIKLYPYGGIITSPKGLNSEFLIPL
jgi:hypothetical protein